MEVAGETEDLATLSQLDEDVLLKELQIRYNNGKIYTYVGDILVAINPFKDLGLYGKEYSARYRMTKKTNNPPHIYAVADVAYQSMLGLSATQPKSQCVLISGESGAGKTESTKLIIKQLIELSRGNSQLEQQIIQVNPLLEAFGNAQTLMNDNSSRFGRYILLKFQNGQVKGSKISEYLLEKSRVVRQGDGEQNFHVFYYMFAGSTPDQLNKYHLKNPKDYRYFTNGAACLQKNAKDLEERYEELINAMDIVGFSQEEQDDMFALLAGVLSLGNIEFKKNDNGEAVLKDKQALNTAAKILGVDAEDLHQCLTCSVSYTRGDEIRRNYSKPQAKDSRDAVAKAVYGRLFSWIVNKVNSLLAPAQPIPEKQEQDIGILDIFGFEHFKHNSFEQACINLANEQLQFFFNKHIFMLEQEEYKREGVDWKEIKWIDNAPLLELFLAKPIGVMALLDEESQFPRGTDYTYVEKLVTKFDDNPHFQKSRAAKDIVFTIKHYAGAVEYNAERWLEKNRDTLPPGVMQMLRQSQNDLLNLVFRATISRTGTLAMQFRTTNNPTKKDPRRIAKETMDRKLTVGAQFKNSLQILMEQMTKAQPIFIRCIKPNDKKIPNNYNDSRVKDQLLYTGMLETTKIRREGFPIRPTFAEFVTKYEILAQRHGMPKTSESCKHILHCCKVTGCQVGKTKIFMRYTHADQLAEHLAIMSMMVVHMQKVVRGFLSRQRVKVLRQKAAQQKYEVQKFLDQLASLNLEFVNTLNKRIEDDKKITKEAIEKARQSGVIEIVVPKAPSIIRKAFNGPTTVDSGVGPDDDMSGEIMEDVPEFTPASTSKVTQGTATEFGESGTRDAAVQWFKKTQSTKVKDPHSGEFASWFHGIIKRRESEKLLQHMRVGCFLVRVSESRFGYTLSFKAEEKVRHYMIDQTRSGKYIIVGEPKVHKTLHDLVNYYKTTKLSNWPGNLSEPCGQVDGECDFSELVDGRGGNEYLDIEPNEPSSRSPRQARARLYPDLPPPLPERNYSHGQQGRTNNPVHRPAAPPGGYESLNRGKDTHGGEAQGRKSRVSASRRKLPDRVGARFEGNF